MAPIRNTRSSRRVPPAPSDSHQRALHSKVASSSHHDIASNLSDEPAMPTITVDGLTLGGPYITNYKPRETDFPIPEDVQLPVNPRPPILKLKDLECIQTLGEGAFAKVLLVRTTRATHKFDSPGTLFAIKVLKKKLIRFTDKVSLSGCSSFHIVECSICILGFPWNPFINGIVETFHDQRNFYFLLELIPGGTLRDIITEQGPLDLTRASFYFSNIVAALAFLEGENIVHCDLKPDNILISTDGYLCLADFGQAKKIGVTEGWDLDGTPTYSSPELINRSGYLGHPIDWWAAGCILFEMLTARLPFYVPVSTIKLYKKIEQGVYRWPREMRVGKNLKSLIKGLLTLDPETRLGSNGAVDVMRHAWLKHIKWGLLKKRHYLAPYVPPAFRFLGKPQTEPLPEQCEVPGLRVAPPPAHLAHDWAFHRRTLRD